MKAGIRFTAGSSHTDEKSSSLVPALGLRRALFSLGAAVNTSRRRINHTYHEISKSQSDFSLKWTMCDIYFDILKSF